LVSLGVPDILLLHKEGLLLSMAGRPEEALPCYRKALGMASKGSTYPRERLYSSLGYALMDLGRYSDAEDCFHRAIESGDCTGNSQDGLAELRLAQGVEIENALGYANQAISHANRRKGAQVPGAYYVHRAWALALLGRVEDAKESLAQALPIPDAESSRSASLCWRMGTVLQKIEQPEDARKYFEKGRAVDPRGKYGCRCEQQLRALVAPDFSQSRSV
jgi:tetratricopeptide (TPR) repeat protein